MQKINDEQSDFEVTGISSDGSLINIPGGMLVGEKPQFSGQRISKGSQIALNKFFGFE